MRQYFTFLLSFSSNRFIAQSSFPPFITTIELWCHYLLGLIPPATTGETRQRRAGILPAYCLEHEDSPPWITKHHESKHTQG
jgi:hypothetical protein